MAVTGIQLAWSLGWILVYLVFWHKDKRGQNLWYIAPWVNIFYSALGFEAFGNSAVVWTLVLINIYLLIKTYTSDNSLTDSSDYTL